MKIEALIEVLQSYVRKGEPTDVSLVGDELLIAYLSSESHRYVYNLKDIRICLVHDNCTMSSSQGCRIRRANEQRAKAPTTVGCSMAETAAGVVVRPVDKHGPDCGCRECGNLP